jgi:hypothetical protein
VSRRPPRQSTVPREGPPHQPRRPSPPRQADRPHPVGRAAVARLVDPADASLLDVLDNLLTKGVVLNAELVLALADVDLVYVRLSALLCAADRILPSGER